jgi:hypothetical protein
MPIPAKEEGEMSIQWVLQCGPNDAAYTNVNGIIACYNFLRNLGGQACGVPASEGGSEFCRAGDAKIVGTSLTRRPESSSWYVYLILRTTLKTKLY